MSDKRTRTNVSLTDEERELLMRAAELTGDLGYTTFIRRVAVAEARKIIAAASETRSGAAGKGNQTSKK
jgi:uncharacterized protein (DUF1778 family)